MCGRLVLGFPLDRATVFREATLSEGVAAASLLMRDVPVQLTGTEVIAGRMEVTSSDAIHTDSSMDRECKRYV